MYIVDYVRGEVVNIDNSISIYVDEDKVYAVTTIRDIVLGEYETPDRAKEVFKEMLEECFNPNSKVESDYKGEEYHPVEFYWMPEV